MNFCSSFLVWFFSGQFRLWFYFYFQLCCMHVTSTVMLIFMYGSCDECRQILEVHKVVVVVAFLYSVQTFAIKWNKSGYKTMVWLKSKVFYFNSNESYTKCYVVWFACSWKRAAITSSIHSNVMLCEHNVQYYKISMDLNSYDFELNTRVELSSATSNEFSNFILSFEAHEIDFDCIWNEQQLNGACCKRQ